MTKAAQPSWSFPLGLVLNETAGDSEIWLNGPLQDALRYCATQGTMRQFYLLSHGEDIPSSIISALTPDGEGVQQSRSTCETVEHSSRMSRNSLQLWEVDARRAFPSTGY